MPGKAGEALAQDIFVQGDANVVGGVVYVAVTSQAASGIRSRVVGEHPLRHSMTVAVGKQ